MPTNDADYSCHIKSHRTYLTNRMGSISPNITPIVINSLRGGHTHTHKHTCIPTFTNRSNSKKPGAHQPAANARLFKKPPAQIIFFVTGAKTAPL